MNTPNEGALTAPAPNAPPKAPEVADLDLNKFFGPPAGVDVPDPATAKLETPPGDQKPVNEATPDQKPADAPVGDQKPAVESEIAAALREMREERAARSEAKQEVQTLRGKYEALQAEYQSLQRAHKFEDDPISYVRAHKWTPEQTTEIIQLLAYDLAPEKAPPGFMMKVLESRRAADKRREEQERTERESTQSRAQEVQYLQSFASQLDNAAQSFKPGAFPANEDWYGDNRRAYVIDMFNLANEQAERARSQGQMADLSAESLAATLEKQNAGKLAALESRRSKRKPAAESTEVRAGASQSTGSPASTQGLRQGGPRPPAMTEEERVKRAIEVAFPVR